MLSNDQLKKILVEENNILTEDQLERLTATAKRTKEPIESLVVAKNYVTEKFMLDAAAKIFNIEPVDLVKEAVSREVLHLVPEKFARTNEVIIFAKMGRQVKVAVADYNPKIINSVEKITGCGAIPYLASRYAIKKALFGYKTNIKQEVQDIITAELKKFPEKKEVSVEAVAPTLDSIVEYAVWANASDIHIEPLEDEVLIRYRIDGLLQDVVFLPKSLQNGLIARIKVLAHLKIDEHRIPQDGRFTVKLEKEDVDFRVSIIPTIFGEKIALRILIKSARLMVLEELGFSQENLGIVGGNIRKPYGMILVTGPTGSGKTTTLYAMLHTIAEEKVSIVNISTIEDPIEYSIRRINQIQINPDVGLTFHIGVRAILRQDPDVIMVGEIRDVETARAAVQATLVGRVVLSSLHTNDAPGAAVRLLDIGVEPYLVSSVLSLVITQRLVRKVCRNCIVSIPIEQKDIVKISKVFDLPQTIKLFQQKGILARTKDPLQSLRVYRGKGCYACGDTGYRGRIGLFEILEVSPQLRQLISERADAVTIREQAVKDGMVTMFQDGFEKAILGFTSLEEVFRATAV